MEELALEAEVVGDAVDGVAADGKPDRLEMHADLVRPAGLEPDVEERVVAHRLLHVEPRHRLARRRRVERVARAIAAVAADRRLDPPRRRLRLAPHERRVGALELARANQLLEQLVRLLRAGDDEQAGRVAIEPVDDPGPVVVVPALGSVGEQPLDERARPRRSGRMDDEAGGLVDDRAGARPPRRSGCRAPPAAAPTASGISTSISSPPSSRKLFARGSPSTSTAPVAIRRSASARESSSGRTARTRSSRAPAWCSGT